MAEWLIGIFAAIGAVLTALLRGTLKREEKLKEEKKDAETEDVLEGAVFGLFAKEDIVNKDGMLLDNM